MRSAQNAHPEFGLWSNLHRKAELGVTFIICGSIAAASEEPQGRLQADLVNPKAPRVLRSPGVGIGKDAHHDPARPHQQHAIARHDVSIAPGLRHANGDLIGHRV